MKGLFVVCILSRPRTTASKSLILLDLMWSDPDDIENWAVSPRGAGWLFGGNVTREVSVYLGFGEGSAQFCP